MHKEETDLIKILKAYEERKNEFNIFKVLKMENGSENRHSNMLKWLLEKDEFFHEFFESLGINIEKSKLSKLNIEREKESDNGRPDIVITSDDFNCIIEVKFGAGETKNQCKNYYETYKNYNFIYLDVNDNSYQKLKYKEDYCKEEFIFGKIYKLATFDKNVIPIINKIIENEKDSIIKNSLEQYLTLLEEKYEMYKGTRIRNKVITYQHEADNKTIKEIQDAISQQNLKYKVVNSFEDRRYEIMKDLYYIIKEKYETKEFKNNSLSIDFTYNGQDITITNAYTKNNSEIKWERNILLKEEEYNELFYDFDNYQKNLRAKFSIIEEQLKQIIKQ